ncbi:MAG: DUF1836 domain-containing protein [Clostridia bacterium]|nr:DUF1836 domain-containing protein [Clostridia bacterium]
MNDLKLDIKDIIDDVFSVELLDTSEIPKIDLYMEQVTSFFEDQLGDMRRKEDDKILTKTMINNYTKYEVLPHPEKKKYSREHMIAMTYIIILKKVLSIQDIKAFFNLTDKKDDLLLEPQYNVFKNIMEETYQSTAELLKREIENMDNTLLENGILDDRARLMTLISCLACEASAFKLLSERLIDRYERREEEDKKQKEDKKSKSE